MTAHEPLPFRTDEEKALLKMFLRDEGQAYVDAWAERILDQARRFGDLDDEPPMTRH